MQKNTDTLTQQELEQVEDELARIIVKHLQESKITSDEAQKVASEFLAALPVHTKKELLELLKSLGQKYKEAQELYVKELKDYAVQESDGALLQMRNAIAQGNMDQALAIAKTLNDTN